MRFYHAKNFAFDRSIGFLLNSTTGALNGRLDALLKEHLAITVAQFRILAAMHLNHRDTAAAISEQLDYDSGALTRMIDRLVAQKWVVRSDDKTDRRAYKLTLTKAGVEMCTKALVLARENLNRALASFTTDEAEQLIALLQKLNDSAHV